MLDGKLQPLVAGRWWANAPLAMVDQYVSNLRKLHAIAMDVGTRDEPIASTTKALDQILIQYEIRHTFETYDGTHTSGVAERMETKVLPFFTNNLAFGKNGAKR